MNGEVQIGPQASRHVGAQAGTGRHTYCRQINGEYDNSLLVTCTSGRTMVTGPSDGVIVASGGDASATGGSVGSGGSSNSGSAR